MSVQTEMDFLGLLAGEDSPAAGSAEDRFLRFHSENPDVLVYLVSKARLLRRRGIKRFGMKALFEKARFDWAVRTGGDDFKLNNSYTAFYARLVMRVAPELDGFFELRKSVADKGEGEK